ncbi:MAG: DUF4358 domain-containing protein [Clostridiales bacterium]|nr:DUF4358 domain-containing protein [Clostridiales bacterium]
MKKSFSILFTVLLLFSLLTGCGKEKTVDLKAVTDAVTSVYGSDYDIALEEVPQEMIEERYGLTADMYTEISAITALMSAQNDEFVAVHAADGKAADVEKALTAYQTMLKEDSFQYPANAIKIQASQVVVHGNYIFFVLRGPIDDITASEEELLQKAKENNQKAVDAVNQFFK